MGRVSESYNEAELCPRRMPMAWWYTLPSQMRTRIRNETGYMPEAEVTYIGEIQDRLIAKGLGRLMGTYMRAMQARLDQEREELRQRNEIIDVGTRFVNRPLDLRDREMVEEVTRYENAAGRHDAHHFGFHEPQIRAVNKVRTGLPPTDTSA